MPRVHVHAAIWIDGQLVVHRHSHQGAERLSLPGGRVKDREGVVDALRREAREEIGRELDLGDLLISGEVSTTSATKLVLVFAAVVREPDVQDPPLQLIDPDGAEAARVLPPVIAELQGRSRAMRRRWLGELYVPQPAAEPRSHARAARAGGRA